MSAPSNPREAGNPLAAVDPSLEQFVGEFLVEAVERIGSVEQGLLRFASASSQERQGIVDAVKRELHTVKGNAGMLGLLDLQKRVHAMEERLAEMGVELDVGELLSAVDELLVELRRIEVAREGGAGAPAETAAPAAGEFEGSVRVPFASLDALMNLFGDLVITRDRLSREISEGRALDPADPGFAARQRAAWNEVRLTYGRLERSINVIQERVMALRMVPLSMIFGSLRRLVHDEAAREGKKVELETVGGDTPLDRALLELASEALGHLVRNSVIHGVETPQERQAAGKPPKATVRVVAAAHGDEVRIEVSDDGRGIDPDRLHAAAAARGIDTEGLEDVYRVIFMDGFSTRAEADLSAGRGVGLSAVLGATERQGGTIHVTSEVGRGTTFHLLLPLNVSITRALIVRVDGEHYAVPLTAVADVRRLAAGEGHRINRAGVFEWREQVITLLDLGYVFQTASDMRGTGFAIVIEAAGRHRGLLVDELAGIQDIVVKGLDPVFGSPPGVAASTVRSDGRPILILDPRSLLEMEPFMEASA